MGSIQRRPSVGVATVASLDVVFPHVDWLPAELPGGVSFAVSPSVGVNERGRPGPDPRRRKEWTRGKRKRRSAARRDQLEKDGRPVDGWGWHDAGGFSLCSPIRDTSPATIRSGYVSLRREGSLSLQPGVPSSCALCDKPKITPLCLRFTRAFQRLHAISWFRWHFDCGPPVGLPFSTE